MKLNSITYTNTPVNFRAQKENAKHNKNVNFSRRPIQQGINTAGAWFGFGVALDFVTKKINFFKSPLKNSIAVNGIIAAAAGLVTAYSVFSQKDKHKI